MTGIKERRREIMTVQTNERNGERIWDKRSKDITVLKG
jgi:hypothetical protein